MSMANDPAGGSAPPVSRAGLCDSCEHQQLVRNTRGSTFSLCRRSRDDPAYPRYPRLPVIECPGYQRCAEAAAGD
jgi:hypothetical protein